MNNQKKGTGQDRGSTREKVRGEKLQEAELREKGERLGERGRERSRKMGTAISSVL